MTTETISFEAPVAALKAALLFAADNDARGYLCGVCVEHGPQGTQFTATDGHRLFNTLVSADTVRAEPLQYVIHRDVIHAAIRLVKRQTSLPIVWEQVSNPDPERTGVTVVNQAHITIAGIQTTDVQVEHGRFPGWTRIVPTKLSGKLAQFNPSYVYDCGKARALLLGKNTSDPGSVFVHVMHNGDGPGFVSLGDDAFAVLIPCRSEESEYTYPKWIFSSVAPVDAKEAA